MKKIRTKPQLLLYAISGMGVNMLNLMVGSYLCSALLVGGFGIDAVPYQTYLQKDVVIAAVWAVFAFVAKIVDGVIDIPMASFTDRLKTRWGRRRPSLVLGMVPMILAYLLFLVVPDASGATVGNTIWFGIILCVFYSFYTLTMVTYYATFTEIVDNESDRNFLSNVKSVCDILYFIFGYVGVRAMLNGINIRTVALMVLPLVLTMVIPLFMIKESPDEIGETGSAQSVNLIKSIGHTFRNKPFVIWMFVYGLMTFGVQLFLGGINEYFSFVGMNMIFVMASSFAPVPLTLFLYNFFRKKFGFGFAIRYTLIIYSLGMFAVFFVGGMENGTAKDILSVVGGIITSFSIGSLFAVAYSVPAQCAAEEEEKTGVSNSAMYFAVQGLFSGVATGIATGIVLTALKGSEEAHSNGIFYMTLIAGLGTFAAFLLTFVLPKSITRMGKSGNDQNGTADKKD